MRASGDSSKALTSAPAQDIPPGLGTERNEALWTFVQTIQPVEDPVEIVQPGFPFNLRPGVAAGQAANFEPGCFEPRRLYCAGRRALRRLPHTTYWYAPSSGKKKLAEKTKIADDLQKSLKESRKENAELQRKVAELEANVAKTLRQMVRKVLRPRKNRRRLQEGLG